MNIDKAKQAALIDALRGGSDLDTACHFAGLSSSQVLKWLELGKNEAERLANGYPATPGQADYVSLWEDLKKARADAIVRNVTYVQRAASDGNWQAAAWWLERTVPETYSKRAPKAPGVEGTKPPKQIEGEG
jgi:hypothetical protein